MAGLLPDRGERPMLVQVGVGGAEQNEFAEQPKLAVQAGDPLAAGGQEEQLGEDRVAALPSAGAKRSPVWPR